MRGVYLNSCGMDFVICVCVSQHTCIYNLCILYFLPYLFTINYLHKIYLFTTIKKTFIEKLHTLELLTVCIQILDQYCNLWFSQEHSWLPWICKHSKICHIGVYPDHDFHSIWILAVEVENDSFNKTRVIF